MRDKSIQYSPKLNKLLRLIANLNERVEVINDLVEEILDAAVAND